MQTTFAVAPIIRGAEASIAIAYGPEVAAAFDFTWRAVAHFKVQPADPAPAAIADTAVDATAITFSDIAVGDPLVGGKHMVIRLTSAQTAAFLKSQVHFDVALVSGQSRSYLPDQWSWPVVSPITVLP